MNAINAVDLNHLETFEILDLSPQCLFPPYQSQSAPRHSFHQRPQATNAGPKTRVCETKTQKFVEFNATFLNVPGRFLVTNGFVILSKAGKIIKSSALKVLAKPPQRQCDQSCQIKYQNSTCIYRSMIRVRKSPEI